MSVEGFQANIFGGWEEEPRWYAHVTLREEIIIDELYERPSRRITAGEAGTLLHRSLYRRCPTHTVLYNRPHDSKDCCNVANTEGGQVLAQMEAKGLVRKISPATYELVEP